MARTLELDTIQFPSASNGTNITLEDGLTKFNTVNVDINGGNIDGTAIGANATSTGAFSTISGTLADGVTATTQATSDDSTKVATTAYVKAVATAEDLDIAGDTGTGAVDLDSQSLTVAGTANEIETSASGQTITIGLPATINADTTGTATNATNAAHVQVTDNESTDESNLITFVENAQSTSGNHGLEMDGNLTYNPSTGTVSATAFSGNGASLTSLNGSNISSGTVAAARVATLNQNTTGSAATLTTGRTISTTGDVTYTSGSFDGSDNVTGTATIPNETVTYAKIQNVADARILGNNSGSAASVSELTGANVGAMIGNATTSANGLMSSADKTALDGLNEDWKPKLRALRKIQSVTSELNASYINVVHTPFQVTQSIAVSNYSIFIVEVDFRVNLKVNTSATGAFAYFRLYVQYGGTIPSKGDNLGSDTGIRQVLNQTLIGPPTNPSSSSVMNVHYPVHLTGWYGATSVNPYFFITHTVGSGCTSTITQSSGEYIHYIVQETSNPAGSSSILQTGTN